MTTDTPPSPADYVGGQEAADLFGVTRSDSVWRAIERCRANYPDKIDVVQVGHSKFVARAQLERFTRWFLAGPGNAADTIRQGRRAQLQRDAEARRATDGRVAVTDTRRRKLAEQIARLTKKND